MSKSPSQQLKAHASNTATSKPKYRKALNSSQLQTLHLIYKFRFCSSQQIATYFKKRSPKDVQKRLKILEDQGLIAKRYDKSYKLRGKPAAYFLLPDGARTVAKNRAEDKPINIKAIYRNKTVSEAFITHCLNIAWVYFTLKAVYAVNLRFFTQTDLNYDQFDYFIRPLPDAYLSLTSGLNDDEQTRDFFLETYEETTPYFVLLRRIKKYLSYAEDGDWATTESDLPTILIICETTSTQKRVRKRIARELRATYEEMVFATTTKEALRTASKASDKIWRLVDEDEPQPEEVKLLPLTEIPLTP